MGRFAAAHSCALRLLIHGGRGRGEWKAAWVIPWLSGTRPGLQLAAADKTHSHLLQLHWLWACGEGEDGGSGACPRRNKHLIPPRVSTDHKSFPWVLHHPTDPTQLPGSSHLQDWAHSISLCTPRSRQEAPGDSEGQEKGMAKKKGCKEWKHGLWDLRATQHRDAVYLYFYRERQMLGALCRLQCLSLPWMNDAYQPYLQIKRTTEKKKKSGCKRG